MMSFFRKLRWLMKRRNKEDELGEELQFHLDEESERLRDEGLSEEDARRAAHFDLGNTALVREDTRAAWGWTFFEQLVQDTRYAMRTIMANKTFASLAFLSLAMGIGANTAIFSLWNGVLHSSLPVVREPEELVMLTDPNASGMWNGMLVSRIDGDRWWLTFEEFQQLRDRAQSFSGVMASQSSLDSWQLRFDNGELEEARGRLVSDNFFEVLGVLRELRDQLRRIPGVEAASFSDNGVLSGGRTIWGTEVEGHIPTASDDGGSSVDIVGADYFSALGIPIVAGRGILESDHAGASKICVINEAFAKRFFAGRNPIGMRITSNRNDGNTRCEVVGIARNARTESLRDDVQPRYFLPAAQLETSRAPFLLIRLNNDIPSVQRIRQVIQHTDPALPIVLTRSVDQQMAPWTAQERTTAQLAVAFGAAALALAAIGVYGVISYGVACRKGEIAIRMALGARSGSVITMILRETLRVVIAGLVVGAGLSYAASRLVASQLFGVAPQDPFTLASSMALLVVIAFGAAFVPAHRASRLDPLTALRQE